MATTTHHEERHGGVSRRSFVAGTLSVAALAALAGCGSSGGTGGSAAPTTAINVGTEGIFPPYSYQNDDGELDGFDVAVAKAVDERLDGYAFDFVQTQWDGIFAALDAGQIDTIANEVTETDERAEKYLFTETPYSWSANALVFKKGRTDIRGIRDLWGKTVDSGIAASYTVWLDEYNEENGNPITVNHTDGDVNKMFQDVLDDRADAAIDSYITGKSIIEEQGLALDMVIFTDAGNVPIYFPFRKDDLGQALKSAIDPIIEELIADGTLARISEQYLGAGYTTEDSIVALAEKQQG